MTDKPDFKELLVQAETIAESATNESSAAATRTNALSTICTLLKDNVAHYDWVGFYLVDPDANQELVLGPYVGAATEHTRIPFGRGICGQAAATEETFIIQDVIEESNYLSCSPDVRSEIVLPILKAGVIVGELDIDSHRFAPFTDDDEIFLTKVCELVAPLL